MIAGVSEIAVAWWGWMGSMLWQVSLLIVLISAIDLLAGKWVWPQVRYALWLLVLVKLLISPSWVLPTSVVSPTLPWAQTQIARLGAPESTGPAVRGTTDEPSPAGASAPPSAGRPSPQAAPPRLAWQAFAMAVWLLGMGLFLVLLLTRIAKLRRWHQEQEERRTIPVWFHQVLVRTGRRLGLERLPAIVFSDEAVTPAVYGVFRPVLLLPADYTDSLSREEAEHVLLHELAHLKRGDLWLHGLCLLLQIVYWFNPLLIWAGKQMQHVREICCDLTVANVLKEKTNMYRKTLVTTARKLLTEPLQPGMGLLGVFEEPFRLVSRLRWLERETWRRGSRMKVAAFVVALLAAPLVLPMGPPAAVPAAAAVTGGVDRASLGEGEGDVHVRIRGRVDEYFLFFRTGSRTLERRELWVGDDRVALIGEYRWLLLDRHESTLTIVNPRTRTYVEASLPLDPETLFSAELQRERSGRRLPEAVTRTGETRTILGWPCEAYEVEAWDQSGDQAPVPLTMTIWATTDLLTDNTLVEDLLEYQRLIDGSGERGRQELGKIRGLQLLIEWRQDQPLFSRRFSGEAVAIGREVPPADVYDAPEGFTRKERLTVDDV